MAHRDEHQATLLRAAALERELAEAKEALADKERLLAERDADELSEAKASKGERAANEELDALRTRAVRAAEKAKDDDLRRQEKAVRAMTKAGADERRQARLRLIRSASAPGGLFAPMTVVLLVPVFIMTFFAAGITGLPFPWCVAIAGTLVASLFCLVYVYAPIFAKRLPGWVASLPYAVPGYVSLLSQKAPRRDECSLTLEIEFAGTPPEDLALLVKAADASLESAGKNKFRRAFPISIHMSKHGTRWSNHDTNLPLHDWFRNIERSVLRPIHKLHPISCVKLQRITSG